MKKILILSVGGSYEPIVNAINFYKPDFVYFFCSSGHKRSAITIVDGPGESCGNKSKSKYCNRGRLYSFNNSVTFLTFREEFDKAQQREMCYG